MAKTLKILMLVENASWPGDQRVKNEAAALSDWGFQVCIICPKTPTGTQHQESYICIDNIHIYRYKLPTLSNKYAAYILEYSLALIKTFWMSLMVLHLAVECGNAAAVRHLHGRDSLIGSLGENLYRDLLPARQGHVSLLHPRGNLVDGCGSTQRIRILADDLVCGRQGSVVGLCLRAVLASGRGFGHAGPAAFPRVSKRRGGRSNRSPRAVLQSCFC